MKMPLSRRLPTACEGLDGVSAEAVMAEVRRNLYDGILLHEVGLAQTMAARALVEQEPNYAYVSARLLLNNLRDEALAFVFRHVAPQKHSELRYANISPSSCARHRSADSGQGAWQLRSAAARLCIQAGARSQLPVPRPADALRPLFPAQGRRALRAAAGFFMRVAMGLALREIDREARAIEFYELLSSFDFMCSTPTLFNAGTLRPQLSSCFLTTISDDLDGIFKAIKDNALLSKYAGGLGNDWSGVRGLGSHIEVPTASRRAWSRS